MVLAGRARREMGLLEKAAIHDIPLICAARVNVLEGLDVVHPDNMPVARMATKFLIGRGHRQIALGGHSHSLTRAERLGGFYATNMAYLQFYSVACGIFEIVFRT